MGLRVLKWEVALALSDGQRGGVHAMNRLQRTMRKVGLWLIERANPTYAVIYDRLDHRVNGEVEVEEYYGFFCCPQEARLMYRTLIRFPGTLYQDAKVVLIVEDIP